MNNFYIYCHQRLDTGKCFYIGKGKDNRAYSKNRRNLHWHNIVKKCGGFDVKILVNNITEEKAFKLEVDFIKQIGFENLCNMTKGGEGMSGYKHTNKSRKNISEKLKGKIRSEEHCKNMSKAKKNQSLETRKKNSESSSKLILQYSKDNQFIKEWISATEAGRILNISQGNISLCAIGKRKSAGRFIWRFKE